MNRYKYKVHRSVLVWPLLTIGTFASADWNPQPNWKDSYAVDGACYCDSNFDHNLSSKSADTPEGPKNVVTICNDIRDKLGTGPVEGRIPYNDIQCGHGPANDAADEAGCPGRVDIGSSGCLVKGPRWNLQAVYASDVQPSEPVEAVQPIAEIIDVTPGADSSCVIVTEPGASYTVATQLFAASCPGQAREDCDPVSGDRWMCSTENIDANTPVPTTTNPPITQPSDPIPVVGADVGRISSDDLVVLHYDNCPDRDDGHALAAGKAVVERFDLQNLLVVNGTCSDRSRNAYQPESEAVARAVWGSQWLDGYNELDASIQTSAQSWGSVLANGGDVWIAEGGPSDFTAKVLRVIIDQSPSLNIKKVHVVQHSTGDSFNEAQTETSNIQLIKREADYIAIPNGNGGGNGSAGLRNNSPFFVETARQSSYSNEWEAAFNYLNPEERLDFSDTVELLYLVDDTATQTVDDFARNYLLGSATGNTDDNEAPEPIEVPSQENEQDAAQGFEPIPWSESFSLNDSVASLSTAERSWSAIRDGGSFGVKNGELAINDAGSEGVFTTGVMDIAATPVAVSLDLRSEGNLESNQDYWQLYQRVDGGAEELIYETRGKQSATAFTSEAIVGDTLQLVVRTYLSWQDETYYLDNLNVTPSSSDQLAALTPAQDPEPASSPEPEPVTPSPTEPEAVPVVNTDTDTDATPVADNTPDVADAPVMNNGAVSIVDHTYTKNEGPYKNPLKGWNSGWDGDNDHPESSVGFQYIPWKVFEPVDGGFNRDAVEQIIDNAGSRNRHLILRLYCDWHGDKAESDCPSWMYSDAGVARLQGSNGRYITDFNDAQYIAQAEAAIQALASEYDNDPRIYAVQMGVIGYWGEWHTWGSDFNGNAYDLTDATKNAILNAYQSSFSNAKIMARYPWREPTQSANGLGYHNDFFVVNDGHSEQFDEALTSGSQWTMGPIGGEVPPRGNGEASVERAELFDGSTGQAILQSGHYSTMKAGSYRVTEGQSGYQEYMRLHKMMGYNYQIDVARFAETVSQAGQLSVELIGTNIGVAPMYFNWDVQFALLDANDNPVAMQKASSDLTSILPGALFNFSTVIPVNAVTRGNYQLAVRIVQPGADTDKSTAWQLDARNTYILFSNDLSVVDGQWVDSKLQGGWSVLGSVAVQ